MLSDTAIWLIALAFFAPLHYLGPMAVAFLTGRESEAERRALLRRILIDCTLTLLLAFPVAVWLFGQSPLYAGILFLIIMALPYVRLVQLRRQAG